MKPIDFILIGVIVTILGLVIWYIVRAKKRGTKCIGCPDGPKCSGNCGCSGNCCGSGKDKP